MRFALPFVLGILQLVQMSSASPGVAPEGKGEVSVGEGDRAIQVFTYKPKGFSNGPILFMFHGAKRNAEDYRNWSIALAEKHHAMVAAPFLIRNGFWPTYIRGVEF